MDFAMGYAQSGMSLGPKRLPFNRMFRQELNV
jgi:hypothetical protein